MPPIDTLLQTGYDA